VFLDPLSGGPAAVGDEAVDEGHLRAEDPAFVDERPGDVGRHEDVRFESGQGGVGAHGAPGVPCRWDRDRLDTQLVSAGDGRGQAPGLERPCRVEAFILDVERSVAGFPFQATCSKERRKSLAQTKLELVISQGEKLAVPPHRRFAAGQDGGRDGRPGRVQVVADEKRFLARRAEVPQPVGVEAFAAQPAFEVRQIACLGHRTTSHMIAGSAQSW
jgi:hypothetical protein